jgi:hypothetical protein
MWLVGVVVQVLVRARNFCGSGHRQSVHHLFGTWCIMWQIDGALDAFGILQLRSDLQMGNNAFVIYRNQNGSAIRQNKISMQLT